MKALGMSRTPPPAKYELSAGFAGWADDQWRQVRGSYPLAAVRDAGTLNELYPASDTRFLRVRAAGGWAVVLDTQMDGHKHFGGMRVGTIVDGLASVESAAGVVRAATGLLISRGVDLIVSNQTHAAWRQAMAGGLPGSLNYLVAFSPGWKGAGDEPARWHLPAGMGTAQFT